MDLVLFLGLWLFLLLLFIVTLLFGQNTAFARTPLPTLHWAITQAPAAAQRVGGGRGAAWADRAADLCCERRNPAIQLLFLALFGGCYWIFHAHVFPMLPLPGVPAWHRYSGSAAAALCLAAFLAACFCDPGAVTPANLAAHQALYPYDGLVFELKDCWTCGLPRPARSKHCRTCGRCISRADHHCLWLNNCVGLLNMRWFLAFLLSTAGVLFYAAVVGYRVVSAHLEHTGAWHRAFRDAETGRLVYLGDSWRYQLRYLSAYYGPQCGVTLFAGLAGWIVAGFTAYQLWLVCAGLTAYEIHKRREVGLALELRREARDVEARAERHLAAGRGSSCRSSATDGPVGASSTALAAMAPRPQPQQQRGRRPPLPNHYHRGAWRNLSEVLFPHYHLRLAAGGGGVKKQS